MIYEHRDPPPPKKKNFLFLTLPSYPRNANNLLWNKGRQNLINLTNFSCTVHLQMKYVSCFFKISLTLWFLWVSLYVSFVSLFVLAAIPALTVLLWKKVVVNLLSLILLEYQRKRCYLIGWAFVCMIHLNLKLVKWTVFIRSQLAFVADITRALIVLY